LVAAAVGLKAWPVLGDVYLVLNLAGFRDLSPSKKRSTTRGAIVACDSSPPGFSQVNIQFPFYRGIGDPNVASSYVCRPGPER
jgi:hypothetical protein